MPDPRLEELGEVRPNFGGQGDMITTSLLKGPGGVCPRTAQDAVPVDADDHQDEKGGVKRSHKDVSTHEVFQIRTPLCCVARQHTAVHCYPKLYKATCKTLGMVK